MKTTKTNRKNTGSKYIIHRRFGGMRTAEEVVAALIKAQR